MPKINLLPNHIAELIAAGEVVERPSSVIKEMVENSIDAGATRITVEIQRGGIMYMRITDNGCGISKEDVPLAFMRHATSKISSGEDLDSIMTLGFRGEALAATASVSKIEMFTHAKNEEMGTHYCISGGQEILNEESGCPEGTTIIVKDLFFNTPARMKFLKKDVSEGNAVAAVMDRLAISHPEVAFKLIREGKQTMSTSGDGKLESAIYSVLGRDFAKSLIPVKGENNRVTVTGFICKPVFCRQSRAGQYVFLNNRLVHSGTVTAAVEQAYKNSAMVGKFPAFVLNVSVPFETVDVNVHPAKTEIRFSDERRVFDAVFYAVKNALIAGDTRPVINLESNKKTVYPFANDTDNTYRQEKITVNVPSNPKTVEQKEIPSVKSEKTDIDLSKKEASPVTRLNDSKIPFFMRPEVEKVISKNENVIEVPEKDENKGYYNGASSKKYTVDIDVVVEEEVQQPKPTEAPVVIEPVEEIRLVGEAFHTYIVVEKGKSIFLIDKHAAHERILYNKLKKEQAVEIQQLLAPISVNLGREEYDTVIHNTDLLLKSGFEVEDFGNSTVIVRAVPSTLIGEDIPSIITEVAAGLGISGSVDIEVLDKLYHTVACKAAIKAGYITSNEELLQLAQKVLYDKDVMYCPHGRPVAYEIKQYDLEKQFGRIQ
ncbi:MAG: DNA mismatch repair endonuclease MutL [Clostridia bacterium]|nr:DNA mismatch repair endonuclease MutL [Clostridia bacterium]